MTKCTTCIIYLFIFVLVNYSLKEGIMKTTSEKIVEIRGIIKRYPVVSERLDVLSGLGYKIRKRRFGSGGIGSIKYSRIETRVQAAFLSRSSRYGACVILDD